MAFDLVIDIENTPGALAQVAAAVSDAGVNIAAATCIGAGERAELHILVPHAGAARHSLAISHLAVTREREVVVVDVEDRPGVLADLTRRIARAGVDLDLVYVATRNRVVFGAPDLDALRAALGRCGSQPLGPLPRTACRAEDGLIIQPTPEEGSHELQPSHAGRFTPDRGPDPPGLDRAPRQAGQQASRPAAATRGHGVKWRRVFAQSLRRA